MIKQYTIALENFNGPDPILSACKEFPELSSYTDRDVLLEALENDKELRVKVCNKHLIVRYVLDGLGFKFDQDEEFTVSDPEATQLWNQYDTEFVTTENKIDTLDEAIAAAFQKNANDV